MIDENLSFSYTDALGNVKDCKILSLFSNNCQSFIVFSDGEVDSDNNIVFKYGKLNRVDDEYEIIPDVSFEELDYIKNNFYDDLLQLSKKIIDENW